MSTKPSVSAGKARSPRVKRATVDRAGSSGPKRASLLHDTWLRDGRLAWPVALGLGMPEVVFRRRLKTMTPDVAVAKPYTPADLELRAIKRREEVERVRAYSPEMSEDHRDVIRNGRPPALDAGHDDYSGVVERDGDLRLAAELRGAGWLYQQRQAEGRWRDLARETDLAGMKRQLGVVLFDEVVSPKLRLELDYLPLDARDWNGSPLRPRGRVSR